MSVGGSSSAARDFQRTSNPLTIASENYEQCMKLTEPIVGESSFAAYDLLGYCTAGKQRIFKTASPLETSGFFMEGIASSKAAPSYIP